jgi:Ni/Co efflux regulator RcnB
MKKFVTAALAAVIATTSVGVASAAEAQSRHDSREWRQDSRNDGRNDGRNVQRHQRQDPRAAQSAHRQQQQAYARWQQSQRRYNAPRYQAPRGYAARQWSYGQRMPVAYRSSHYVVNDYNRYGLRAPPRGYHYVRSGNDVVLAAIAGGLITAVIAGLFN